MKPVLLLLLFITQNNDPTTGLTHYQNGYEAQQNNAIDSAIYYYQQALRSPDLKPSETSGVLINLSIIHKNRGQYDQALEYAFEALPYNPDPTRSRSSALNTIASTYYLIGDHSKALDYYLQTLAIREELDYKKGIAISLNNISNVFIAVEQYDSALAYLNRTLTIREALNDQRGIALAHNNLGLAQLNLENYAAAEEHLKKALVIKKELQLNASMSHTYRLLGALYLKQKRYEQAKVHLDLGLNLARKHQLRKVEKQLLEALARYHWLKGDFRNQARVLNTYIILSDSLLNEEKTRALTDMQVKYESEKKDQEISYLEAVEQLQKNQIAQQRQLTLIGFATAFLFLLVGTMAVRYYLNANKRKRQIELLHKDMKHRVSNHLQLLISLLKWQKAEVAGSAREVLNHTENRVEAMALVHQKLFSGADNMKIDIKLYLEELLFLLEKSFQGQNQLSINTKIEPLQIDVNLVTYMGLIVNELITNAVKHAFREIEGSANIDVILASKSDGILFLEVRDNGSGLPEELTDKSSFGSQLIHILTRQIQADSTSFNQDGAVFQFSIPYEYAA